MSYEDNFLSGMDYKLSKEKNISNKEIPLDELLKKREAFLKKNRPEEKNFTDIYTEEEIKKDLEEVKVLKELWQKNGEKEGNSEKYLKKVSSVYEILLAEQIELNSWLGENCETFVTSEYDDIKNGIDVGIIFKTETEEKEKKHLGFSTDVTFSSKKEVLHKKLDSIKKCIFSGSLPTLKYFEDPETGERKKMFLPKVIVGSSLSSAEKVIKLWGSSDPHKNKKLSENPLQSQIILESLYQLEYFYNYSKDLADKLKGDKEKSKKYLDIALSYGQMYNIFYDIYNEEGKNKLINSHIVEISSDVVYDTIREYTGH